MIKQNVSRLPYLQSILAFSAVLDFKDDFFLFETVLEKQ